MRRTLSAVLAADVVGSSALMSADADGTLATLRRLRAEILGPAVAARHGRVIKSMGDGWIVVFNAVADAVEGAMQVQDRLKIDRAMQLRMGLHLGDVAEADEDVFGDGVNIAARLQDLAEPDALAISGAARALLDGTLRPSFDDAGERELKNIAEPVPVWVRGGDVAGNMAVIERGSMPRLAILPVTTQNPRDDVQELAMALTGDLATHLNVYRFLTAAATKAPEATDYRLISTLRARDDRIRLEARLLAPDGTQVAANKFDGDLSDSFDWQDDTSFALAQAVMDGLFGFELSSFSHQADEDCTAEQLMLRHILHRVNNGPDFERSIDVLRISMDKSPEWVVLYATAVSFILIAVTNGCAQYVTHHIPMMKEWMQKADALEPPFTSTRVIFAIEKVARRRDLEGAVDDVRLVLRNLPFDPEALGYAGWVYNYCGRSEDALRCFDQMKRAVTLDFMDQLETNGRAMALMMAGEHKRASDMYVEITTRWPNYIGAHMIGAASSIWAGDEERAEKAIKRVLELSPGLTL